MFSRHFMRSFPVRKYGEPVAKGDTVVSDKLLYSSRDVKLARWVLTSIFCLTFVQMTNNGHSLEKMFRNIGRPACMIFYKGDIESNVLSINEEIIERFKAINQVKNLVASRQESKMVITDKDGNVIY